MPASSEYAELELRIQKLQPDIVDVVDDDDDVVVFVVVLSQKPSIKSLVKMGSVIDEMLLLLLFLLIPETYI